MAIEFLLGTNPIWNFSFNDAKFLVNGQLSTFRDVARSEKKAVYHDGTGLNPWTDPIQLDASGSVPGPIYWEDDEPYYIEIRDSTGSQVIRTIPNYTPPTTGSSPPVTINQDFDNYIQNGDFQFFNQQKIENASIGTEFDIAPSWTYKRSNATALDTLEFKTFNVGQTDVTEGQPQYYFNIQCTSAGSGELFKDIEQQFESVIQFQNTPISLSFQANLVSGNDQIKLIMVQHFGTGGSPSTDVETILQTFTITSGWNKWSIPNQTLPIVGGKTLGTNGDDYLSFILRFPLDTTFQHDVTNIALNVGSIVYPFEYFTVEEKNIGKRSLQLPDYSQDLSVDQYFSIQRTAQDTLSWASPVPVGSSMNWWTSSIPDGWLKMIGNAEFTWIYKRLFDVLDADYGYAETTATILTNVVTITNVEHGVVTDIADINTGFPVAVTQQGAVGTSEVYTITTNDASTLSGGEALTFATPAAAYKLWFNRNFSSVAPSFAGFTEVRIDFKGTETNSEMAALISSVFNPLKFILPDTRGRFIRSVDDGAGRDTDAATRTARADGTAGDNVGTTQDDDIKNHSHSYISYVANPGSSPLGDGGDPREAISDNTGGLAGTETRSKNIYSFQIIKY